MCSERLPDKSGWYYTDDAQIYFSADCGCWEGYMQLPLFWMEPIYIPTDFQIEKMAREEYNTDYTNDLIDKKHWKLGFKAAIKFITQTKKPES